jgi:hypothetical protein
MNEPFTKEDFNRPTPVRYEDLNPEQKAAARQRHAHPKRIDEMTAAELKAHWQSQRPQDFEQADPLQTMPLAELRAKADAEARQQAVKELDERRVGTAVTFMSVTPAYKMCQKNAEAMEAELNRRGLAGTVSDLQAVFSDLAAQGRLELNPVLPRPKRIYSPEELRAMPLDEMRAAIAEMSRNGIY